ncbi:MAG: hypothetical protein ACREMX_01460 [Gemmatimonadales bacterium]
MPAGWESGTLTGGALGSTGLSDSILTAVSRHIPTCMRPSGCAAIAPRWPKRGLAPEPRLEVAGDFSEDLRLPLGPPSIRLQLVGAPRW